jgi:uncharacterized LabA/DUF88 family protein
MKNRVAVYIDGFNLYHAIDDLNYRFRGRQKLGPKPAHQHVHHLKWVNLWALSESLLRDYQELVAVNYYSAYATWRGAEFRRHQVYTAALEAAGVRVVMSVFKEQRRRCNQCGAQWTRHEEKESDVRIATDLMADALQDKFDDAFIISADSDMKPPLERVRIDVPEKNVVVAAPPKRFAHARDLRPAFEVTQGKIAKALFSVDVRDAAGNIVATRPEKYTPPT